MKEITPLLEKLANQLGTTAKYLWNVLIRQAPINSVINIIQWIVLGCLTWIAWKVFKKMWSKAEAERWDSIWLTIPSVAGIIFLILWIACVCSMTSTITGFINPEYWALEKILDAIGKK